MAESTNGTRTQRQGTTHSDTVQQHVAEWDWFDNVKAIQVQAFHSLCFFFFFVDSGMQQCRDFSMCRWIRPKLKREM